MLPRTFDSIPSSVAAGAVRNLRSLSSLCALHAAEPIVDVLLHLVLRVTVARLDLAFELLAVAVDLREVVVGELAPLCLHLAGDLLPIAGDAVPVHGWLLNSD